MWTLVFRKILNNKWMMLCLLFGFIVVVAMVSAVPMYSNAILQKMFIGDLTNYQSEHSAYAGMYQLRAAYGSYSSKDGNREKAFNKLNQFAEDKMARIADISDTDRYVSTAKAINMILTAYDETDESNTSNIQIPIELNSVRGMEDYISLIAGRVYEPGMNDNGEYEFICTEMAYNELGLNLDSVYRIASITSPGEYTKARLVGVFTMKENTSNYWYIAGGIEKYQGNILMDYNTMLHTLFRDYKNAYLNETEWRMAIDFTTLSIDNLTPIIDEIGAQASVFENESGFSYFRVPMYDTLISYTERSVTLKLELWTILAPILVMLALYIFMVTKTIITNDADEISVLRSRGASAKQIFVLYLYESIVLGATALLIGPFLAYFMCIIMGSANGFLEFIGRSALPVAINFKVYLYALGAVLLFIATMLIPALSAARSTIVERKRRHSRFGGQSLWKKFFLDFILLGISIYGFFNYQNLSDVLMTSGEKMSNYSIDPVLFLLSSIFIIGSGLLFLRIYPYIVRLVFIIGRRKWSPDSYAAFIQVSRSDGREQFLMLFLILSVAVGIFSANAARTLNQNIEDRIHYDNGASITLTVDWLKEQAYDIDGRPIEDEYINIEPDFTMYQEIDGVDSATKVYNNPNAKVQSKANSSSQSGVSMLAIEPAEFADTTWTRNDLFEPYHINAYLKLLSEGKRSTIISRSLSEKLNLSVGDIVNVSINDEPSCEMIIYAIIDYWPSIQPIDENGRATRWGSVSYNHFMICNLSFINSKFTKQPYNVWIDKEDGVSDTQILNYINDHPELRVLNIKYVDQQLIAHKNDPQLQGFNGMLTLGFIITMFICVIGFLIYWIISIKSRTMQFGVLRAMGMPFSGILRIILIEQLLISFVSILMGIILGGIASDMFVPMLELMFPIEQQVPEFIVVALRSDYFKVYALIIAMLAAGIGVLSRMIRHTRIDQALKLGED